MAWVVDTNVLIDVGEGISPAAESAFELLESERPNGLIISPISYVEFSLVKSWLQFVTSPAKIPCSKLS